MFISIPRESKLFAVATFDLNVIMETTILIVMSTLPCKYYIQRLPWKQAKISYMHDFTLLEIESELHDKSIRKLLYKWEAEAFPASTTPMAGHVGASSRSRGEPYRAVSSISVLSVRMQLLLQALLLAHEETETWMVNVVADMLEEVVFT